MVGIYMLLPAYNMAFGTIREKKLKIPLRKGVVGKMTVCLFLISFLWGCGQSEGNVENERHAESSKQADEAVQTEEGEISDYSVVFADATMKKKISEACNGKPDKEHLEAALY